jgi:hypothetical protein
MKATRYILFALSGVFVAPIVLAFLGSLLPLPDDGFLRRFFFDPNMEITYALYHAGVSRKIVSTGGHFAILTTLGICVVYLLPASVCFVVALLLKPKRSHETHAA